MKTMTENNPEIYQAVVDDLEIDPEEQTLISNEERFQNLLAAHRSELI